MEDPSIESSMRTVPLGFPADCQRIDRLFPGSQHSPPSGSSSRIVGPTMENSRRLIGQWTDDETAGEFVVSALVTAYKPAA